MAPKLQVLQATVNHILTDNDKLLSVWKTYHFAPNEGRWILSKIPQEDNIPIVDKATLEDIFVLNE